MQEEQSTTNTEAEMKHFQIIYTMSNGERQIGVESFATLDKMNNHVEMWLQNDWLHIFVESDRRLTIKSSEVVSYAIRELDNAQIAEAVRQMALGNAQPQEASQPNRAERRAKGKKQ